MNAGRLSDLLLSYLVDSSASDKGVDAVAQMRRFADTPGAQMWAARGGEVSVYVPMTRGFDGSLRGPDTLGVFGPGGEPLAQVSKGADVELNGGVVTLREFRINPLAVRAKLRELLGDRAPTQIGLRGEGKTEDQTWSPLGFPEAVYPADLASMVALAVAEDERVSILPARETEVASPAAVTTDAANPVTEALAQAAAVLDAFVGGAGGTKGHSEALLQLAEQALRNRGLERPAATIAKNRAGEEVATDDLERALGLALGSDFVLERAVTVELVSEILRQHASELDPLERQDLKALYAALEHQNEVATWGAENVDTPASSATVDRALRKLFNALTKSTSLDPDQLFRLSSRLLAAANHPKGRPEVFVLCGPENSGIENLLEQMLKALPKRDLTQVQGTELRNGDAWGVLVGTPDNAQAPAVLLRDVKGEGPHDVVVRGTEQIGIGAEEGRQGPAQQAFFAGLAAAKREGWVRGYDAAADQPVQASLLGGVWVIRDTRTPDQLREAMGPEIWRQLSGSVYDFGSPSVDAAVAELKAELGRYVTDNYRAEDVSVELSPALQLFVREVIGGGGRSEAVIPAVVDLMQLAVIGAFFDNQLGHTLHFDFAPGVPQFERDALVAKWIEGDMELPPGLSSLFALRRETREHMAGDDVSLTALEKRLTGSERYTLVGQYQLAALRDSALLTELADINHGLEKALAASQAQADADALKASKAVADVKQLMATMREAAGQIVELNQKIGALNEREAQAAKVLGDTNENLKVATKERDEINAALAEARRNNALALRELANTAFEDASAAFEYIIKTSKEAGHLSAAREEILLAATCAAFKEAAAAGGSRSANHGRFMGKVSKLRAKVQAQFDPAGNAGYDHVVGLVQGYIQASVAMGYKPHRGLIDAFASAAQNVCNRFFHNDQGMREAWRRDVLDSAAVGGKESAFLDELLAGWKQLSPLTRHGQ